MPKSVKMYRYWVFAAPDLGDDPCLFSPDTEHNAPSIGEGNICSEYPCPPAAACSPEPDLILPEYFDVLSITSEQACAILEATPAKPYPLCTWHINGEDARGRNLAEAVTEYVQNHWSPLYAASADLIKVNLSIDVEKL